MSDSRSGKPIKKEELTAFERWELPLMDEQGNEIREDVEPEVKPLTAEDLETIRQEAHLAGMEEGLAEGRERGYREGFEKGRLEGFEAGQTEGRELGRKEAFDATEAERKRVLERLNSVVDALLEPLRQHEEALEEALLNLVMATVRAVLWRELVMDSSQIGKVVHEAINSLPDGRDRIRVHVHPDDMAEAERVIHDKDAEMVFVADPAVLPGGCRVETRYSLVDYTLEKRFQKVVQGLLDNVHQGAEVTDVPDLETSMGELSSFQKDVLASPAEEEGNHPIKSEVEGDGQDSA